jgi:2-keto-4-pentenoate hydratase/2-oxohepta-3-ene-1,7-dioic acid hydratase in catechol pathway
MKLCRFDEDRLGVVIDGMIHDITDIQDQIRAGARYDMRGDAVIAALPQWRDRMEEAAAKVPGKSPSEVALLAPVARPSKVMAAPVNYAAHVAEMAAQPHVTGADQGPKRPSGIQAQGIFLKANSALVGASEGVAIRFPDRRNDHEVELCVIIGKQGSHVTQADALDYVAGYTLGLDMTVRGREDRSFRKSCDGYAPLGPWMTTADEIPEPNNVDFTVHLNGELKQDAHSKDMIFHIPRLIEFATEYYTIYPGDVLFTGSPPGVSEVKAGDVMVCNCDLIGSMEVKVREAE